MIWSKPMTRVAAAIGVSGMPLYMDSNPLIPNHAPGNRQQKTNEKGQNENDNHKCGRQPAHAAVSGRGTNAAKCGIRA